MRQESYFLELNNSFEKLPSFLLFSSKFTNNGDKCIKTESTRKLRNFNFQWTKVLYQNNLNNITFFFTLFKGYRCN